MSITDIGDRLDRQGFSPDDAYLAALVSEFTKRDVPIWGRKAMQKLLYFSELAGWPTHFNFRLHLFGPYADVAAIALDRLEQTGAIRVNEERAIVPGLMLEPLAATAHLTDAALEAVDKVAALFGHDSPRKLELLATVAFTWRREVQLYGRTTEHQVARSVRRYKGPKFTDQEIAEAISRLKETDVI